MAYDPRAENLRHLRRIATGLLDFRGRSSRSEFILYWVPALLLMALGTGFLRAALPVWSTNNLDRYLELTLWLFATPLFVRRLHDQDRTGWLSLVLPMHVAYRAYELVLFEDGRLPAPDLGFPYTIVESVLAAVFLGLAFWPPTPGENRFGPDPRLEHGPAAR